MSFEKLGLSRPILDALTALQIDTPTPIQLQAIPSALAGRDIVGLAQTGTGKTAAFALPLIERLAAGGRVNPTRTRALILSPTRELAAQIHNSIRDFTRRVKLRSMLAVGGMSIRPQIKNLQAGTDILIATPGRLEDLIRQGALHLDQTGIVVLDEADQMLDIGFMPAIRRILTMTPQGRQTMLFSATMPKEIRALSDRYLKEPVEISVIPATRTADRIDQSVIHLNSGAKTTALTALIHAHDGDRVIVFARTKHGADKVVRRLDADGISAAAIHGNKSQGQRERALNAFRDGRLPVLVATDIAARGIDVPGVTLVVNHDLPNVPEVYVHRIGRTARAGRSGQAITLCAPDERPLLRDIERLIKLSVPLLEAPEGIATLAVADEPRRESRPATRNGRAAPGNRTGQPQGRRHHGGGTPRGEDLGARPQQERDGQNQKRRNRPKRRKSFGQGGPKPARAIA